MRALSEVPHRVHYSLKANANRAILDVLRGEGAGVDVVSGGELFRALRAGFRGEDILFGGVGKTERELREALVAECKLINVESEAELRRLSALALEVGRTAAVGLRINPEVDVVNAQAQRFPDPQSRRDEYNIKNAERIRGGRLIELPDLL